MTITVIEHGEFPQQLCLLGEWRRLQAMAGDSTLFTTPEWVQTWMEVFGENKRLRLLEVRLDEHLLGVVPLVGAQLKRSSTLAVYHDLQPEDRKYVTRSGKNWLPVRQLSVPANLESANLRGGWVCQPEQRAAVLQAAFAHLAGDRDWDVLVLPSVKLEDASEVIRCAQDAGLRSRILLENALYGFKVRNWEQYLAEQSTNFRKGFRSAANRLRACGETHIETLTDPARISIALESMFELARLSWKEEGRSGQATHLPLTEAAARFYRMLAQRLAPTGNTQLFLLSVNGEMVGCMLTYSADERLYGMQIFYNPAFAHISPGRFLMREMIQWASSNDIRWVDLNGNSALVTAYSEHAQKYQRLMLFRPGAYPNLLYRLSNAALLAARVRSWVAAKSAVSS